MSLYLLTSSTAVQNGPPAPVQPLSESDRQNITVISSGGFPPPGTPVQVAEKQAFVLTVKGTGNVSASAQMVGSNDPYFCTNGNYVTLGDPIHATGSTSAVASMGGTAPFAYFGAFITAISGVNATAAVTMSA